MKRGTRATALLIALCLIAAPVAQSVSIDVGIGVITETSLIQMASSAILVQNTLQHNTAGLQSERYIEWSYGSQLTPVVAGNTTLYGSAQTLNNAAAQLSARGNEVVAGLNGDYFTVSNGIPQGIMVTDGILRTSDSGLRAVGFTDNGNAIIGHPWLTINLGYNGGSVKIDHVNKPRAGGLNLYTPDFGADTNTTTPGTHVILNVGDNLRIGSTIGATVHSIVKGNTPAALLPGQMCLSVADDGPVDRISALYEGMSVSISVSTNDARFMNCSNIIGAYQSLVENGQAQSSTESARAPRTAVGIKSDGTAVFYTVDGRQSGYSVGLTLTELAERMRSLGCVTAVNLDGGGSTNMSARYPGDTGITQLGKPSDGTPRKCANYIFFVNNTPRTGIISRLHTKPSQMTMLIGSELPLSSVRVTATDSNYHTIEAPDGITWQSGNPQICQLTGDSFIAGAAGNTTMTVYMQGTMESASVDVSVVDTPDSIRLINQNTQKEVTELTLNMGESVNLSAIGVYNGKDMVARNDLFSWQTTGYAATVTPGGIVTAGAQYGSMCYLVVALGNATKTIPVTVGKPTETLTDFETAAGTPFEAMQAGTGFTRTAERTDVKYGHFAGKFLYDFTMAGGVAALSYPAEAELTNQPSYLNFWLKGDGSGNILNLLLIDTAGQPLEMTAVAALNNTQYQFISVPLPNNISKMSGFKLLQSANGASDGSFMIDQLNTAFDSRQNLQPPVISLLPLQGSLSDGLMNISGTVQNPGGTVLPKSSITVTWDGAPVPFTYDPATGAVTASVTMPTEGFHRATVEAVDSSGNYERVSRNFSQPTIPRAESFTDISDHWSLPYIEFLDRKGIYPAGSERVFDPDSTITRAEVAILMARVMKLDTGNWSEVVMPYADQAQIPPEAYEAVRALYANGIMQGSVSNGVRVFNPNSTITRAETFTMLSNAFPQGMIKPRINFTFEDTASIPEYAADPISLLMNLEIIDGDNNNRILPGGTVTRSQIAKLLCSLY